MNLFELFVKISADTSQAEKGMKNTQENSETLTNKIKVMSAQFEAAQKNVDKLTQEFNESVKETGATSKETQELAKKLDDAEKEAEQAKKALDGYNSELGETETKAEKAGGGLSNLTSKLGKGLATAAKVGTAAVTAASGAIVGLTKQSVESYAEYEQLVGGVETLYGSAYKSVEEYAKGVGISLEEAEMSFEQYQNRQQDVLNNAANAYKTAGMSTNEYMDMVNGFAASLTNSLGEYEWQAASYADMIATDISDNANKMGSDLESLKLAYGGFAKGNFTMLDNLKLGYGGTKEEMERLLRKAEEIEGYTKGSLSIESFADIAEAINIVQTEMGITGTTAKEAASTIQGSLAMTKSSWENLLTGMSDEGADFEGLIDNFVESVGIAAENILPRIEVALNGAASLVEQLLPVIVARVPEIINNVLPSILSAAVGIVESLVKGISDNKETLLATVFSVIELIVNSFVGMLPEIIQLGFDLIVSLAQGLAENLSELVPTIVSVILEIVDILTDDENLSMLLDAALEIIIQLAYGIMDAIPQLAGAIVDVISNIQQFLLDPKNISMILSAAWEIIVALATGVVSAIPEMLRSIGELINDVIKKFTETDWGQIGKDLVAGFKRGIENAWTNLKTWFTNLFGDLKSIAKKILGISSPSKVFKQYGKFVDEGLAIGLEENADVAFKAVDRLSKGVRDGFDVSLGANYIGTYGITNGGFTTSSMSTTDKLLNELISMFKDGTATTNVGNTRELRRAVNA